MSDFVTKNLSAILAGAGLVAVSTGIGYAIAKQSGPRGFHFKSYVHGVNPLTDYITENSLREPEFLRKLREETQRKSKMAVMLADPLEAQFFRLLLKAIGAKRCIEVGVFTGYNACSAALALPEDGEVIACDISEDYMNIGKPYWSEECAKKIKVKIAPALDTLDELVREGQEGTFDFAFIDADKLSYDKYYERAIVLVRKGGIIAVDNTLWSGKVTEDEKLHDEDTRALHMLNKKLKQDERIELSFLNLGDGTTICRKI
eukprot:gene11983-13221_t